MSESTCRVVGCSEEPKTAWPIGNDADQVWVLICRPHLNVLAVDQRSSLTADGGLVLGAQPITGCPAQLAGVTS